MADIRLRGVTKRLGSATILDGLDLAVEDGEFLVLLGPSGTGKTMTVNLVAGTAALSEGEISIGGRVVNDVEPRNRNVAVTFQSYALYPHLTVRQNLAFPLRSPIRSADHSDSQVEARVGAVADVLEIEELLERKPAELSGGQRQRVALGRMLVRRPDAYLMDEPLAHLDARLRHRMRGELKRMQRESGVTTLYATPDQLEALSMGDRVAVMNWGGRIEQLDAPTAIFERPATAFVAGFTGNPPMNLFEARVRGSGAVELLGITVALPGGPRDLPPTVRVGVRPHHLGILDPGAADLRGEVVLVERAGREVVSTVAVNGSTIKTKTRGSSVPAVGEAVGIDIPARFLHLFDVSSGDRL